MSVPCTSCGAPAQRISVEKDGVDVTHGWNCDACFDSAMAEFVGLQQQFRDLIVAGVDRKRANDIMIERIGGAAPS